MRTTLLAAIIASMNNLMRDFLFIVGDFSLQKYAKSRMYLIFKIYIFEKKEKLESQ